MDGMNGMGMGIGIGMMVVGMLIGLAVLVLAVVGIVWLVRGMTQGSEARPGPDPAEAELRLRYAQGAIDRDEYQRRLDDLTGRGPNP